MKKLISMILALCVALALMTGAALGEGRQLASAVLDIDTQPVIATVDLTGGWSVEFAAGAFFLYEGEFSEDTPAKAIGLTLEQDVYEEYLASAKASDTLRELDNGVAYDYDEGTYYVIPVGSSAYFLLDVPAGEDGDAILARIELMNQNDYYASMAPEQEEGAVDDIPESAFEGQWVAGRGLLTIADLDDVVYCTIVWGTSAAEASTWEYECSYDEGSGALTSLETGVRCDLTFGEDGEIAKEEVVFEDGAASFTLNDDGTLTWTNFRETPGQNEIVFERMPE